MTQHESGTPPPATGQMADQVAAAVTACPAVAGLADGALATYLPGRTVAGVAVRAGSAEVAVVARLSPMADVAGQVRAAISAVAPGLRVDVHIVDVEDSDHTASRASGE